MTAMLLSHQQSKRGKKRIVCEGEGEGEGLCLVCPVRDRTEHVGSCDVEADLFPPRGQQREGSEGNRRHQLVVLAGISKAQGLKQKPKAIKSKLKKGFSFHGGEKPGRWGGRRRLNIQKTRADYYVH